MVNTLRRKKDKEAPAVVDSNGGVSNDSSMALISTSVPAPAALQTSVSVEEKNRTVASHLKVSFSLCLIVYMIFTATIKINKHIIWLTTLVLM